MRQPREPSMQARLLRLTPWLLAGLTWSSALLVYLHAWMVARWFGQWPRPAVPDPAGTPFQPLHAAATLVFLAVLATPLWLLCWGLAKAFARSVAWNRPGLAACVLSYAAWYAWAFKWDPGSVVAWLLD